jgi:hypothetical protein
MRDMVRRYDDKDTAKERKQLNKGETIRLGGRENLENALCPDNAFAVRASVRVFSNQTFQPGD